MGSQHFSLDIETSNGNTKVTKTIKTSCTDSRPLKKTTFLHKNVFGKEGRQCERVSNIPRVFKDGKFFTKKERKKERKKENKKDYNKDKNKVRRHVSFNLFTWNM